MPTGCRSEYLEVISKVVPKIWARTNSAILMRLQRKVSELIATSSEEELDRTATVDGVVVG